MALTKITSSLVAINSLTAANIADNAVDATKIASNSILTRHIDDDQITGAQLADNIDIVGTFDVTGATTLDSTLAVAGLSTITKAGDGNNPILHVTDTADTEVAWFEGNRAGDTGAFIAVRHNPSSPAESNRSGIKFQADDDAGNVANYARITQYISDNTNGTEDGDLAFNQAIAGTDTEVMRLKTGNLHLNRGTDVRIQLGSSGAGANSTSNDTVHIRGDGDSMKLMAAADGHYIFEVNGSEKMRIASTGELGIGNAAPDALGSGYSGIQIGGYGYNIGHSGGDHYITNNAYHNSGWKHGQTSTAQKIQLASGQILMRIAPSGSADSAVGWTNYSKLHGTGVEVYHDIFSDSGSDRGAGYFRFLTDGASAEQSVAQIYMEQGSGDGGSRKCNMYFQVSDNGNPVTAMTIENNKNVTFADNVIVANTKKLGLDGTVNQYLVGTAANDKIEVFTNTSSVRCLFNASGVTGVLNDSSDRTLKENIINLGASTTTLKALTPRTFDWKAETDANDQTGFIAQEVEEVDSNLVSGEEGEKAINTIGILAIAVKTIQELEARIATLEG